MELRTQYLATYARKWYYVIPPLERGSVALFKDHNFPIFQCCHLPITIMYSCAQIVQNVLLQQFDPSNPLPEKRSIRLEHWTKHPYMVIKHTKKLWAFLDHFFTHSGAQNYKKLGVTAFYDPENPANLPPPLKMKCTTGKWDQVLMYGHKTLKKCGYFWTTFSRIWNFTSIFNVAEIRIGSRIFFFFRYFYVEECLFTFLYR